MKPQLAPKQAKAEATPVAATPARPIAARSFGSNRALTQLFRMARPGGQAASPLTIAPPNDTLEIEADRVADAVMRMPDGTAPAGIGSAASAVQRKCSACAEEDDQPLRRSATGPSPAQAPPIVHDVLSQPGRPLDSQTRSFFEPRLGADLSSVRIHDNASAAASAKAVQARAYTVGNAITFGEGQYVPQSKSGKGLLAHELVHVMQRRTESEFLQRRPMDYDPPEPLKSNRELIDVALKSEDPADVKKISNEILASEQVTDPERAKLISTLCNKQSHIPLIGTWIGPRDEWSLESLWKGYGERLFDLDWKVYGPLWKRSSEGGAELSELLAVQQKIRDFRDRARDITLTMMDTSEQAINEEKTRYGLETKTAASVTGAQPTTTPMQIGGVLGAGLFAAAGQLAPKLEKVFAARMLVGTVQDELYSITQPPAFGDSTSLSIPSPPRFSFEELEKYKAQFETARFEYDAVRLDLEPRFPILAVYTAPPESLITTVEAVAYRSNISSLQKIAKGSTEERAGTLIKEVVDRLEKINQIRTRFNSGKEKDLDQLWKLPRVMAVAKADQKADPGSLLAGLVDAKIKDIVADEQFVDMLIGAVAIALGLIAAIPTGGASLAVAGVVVAAGVGAATASTISAARSIDKYRLEAAASGTAFDRAQALSGEDPSLAWLALDIAGAIVDMGTALKAFKAAATAARGVRAGQKSAAELGSIVENEAKTAFTAAGKVEPAAASEAAALGKRVEQEAATHHLGVSNEVTAVDDAMKAAEKAVVQDASVLGKTADGVHDLKVSKVGKLVVCSDPCMFLEEKFAGVLTRDNELNGQAKNLMARAEAMIRASEPEKSQLLETIKHDYQVLVERCEGELTKTEQVQVMFEEVGKIGEIPSDPFIRDIRKLIGDRGETIARDVLAQNGFTDIRAVQNASNHGLDIVAQASDGRIVFFEVKTTESGFLKSIHELSTRQKNPEFFIRDVLSKAIDPKGRYGSLSPAERARAENYLTRYIRERKEGDLLSAYIIQIDLVTEHVGIVPWRK